MTDRSAKPSLIEIEDTAKRQHPANGKTSGRISPLGSALFGILAGSLLALGAGCESTAGQQQPVLADQIDRLKAEKTQLQSRVAELTDENEQLAEQVEVLLTLPKDRIEDLYSLQAIKITRYTNFYDKDKDGKKEQLIVYIQPIDRDGDVVKALGSLDVQLWDLSKENGKALLKQWQIEPSELRKLWFKTIVTVNYRLTFDVADEIGDPKNPMTLYVTFTDYLTGKVFEEQKVIKPR